MTLKKFTCLLIVLATIGFALIVFAETPCTHIGHETLQGALVCAQRSARAAAYMDSHNRQIMNCLANQPALPPQPYPMVMVPNTLPYFLYSRNTKYGRVYYGFQNTHLMWPNSWYYYNPY